MRNPQTPEQMIARHDKGFGQGEGASYKPWLEAHHVPSNGVTSRFRGWKTGRQHVVFSHIEKETILCAQFLDKVLDIREQFPLFPLERTEELAAELGVTHPRHPKEKCPIMMTTDILLTERVSPGVTRRSAIAVKPSDHLENKHVLEKLEIERLYWESQGVSWSIVTERELPKGLVKNLTWIDAWHEIPIDTMSPAQVVAAEALLLDRLMLGPALPLNVICSEVDDRIGLKPGDALGVVRHCLSRKKWTADLRIAIDTNRPFRPLRCNDSLEQAA